ncbi:MAG: DUF488 domain-containing protein [Planctomycetota bacterium]|nr:DUF488 domain-containing protein [Planctomycetota bacterium]
MLDASLHARQFVYSIGHSNHDEATFVELLKRHEIDVVADVRSQPYSKYLSHFNADQLKSLLTAAHVRYLFLGTELGGRPDGDEFYDPAGHVLYDRLAQSPSFLSGIERVEKGCRDFRVALMCSEENPADCHRFLLVSRVLAEREINVRHIRADGRILSDRDVAREQTGADRQPFLFEELEVPPWRSIRSVLPKQRPATSSND